MADYDSSVDEQKSKSQASPPFGGVTIGSLSKTNRPDSVRWVFTNILAAI